MFFETAVETPNPCCTDAMRPFHRLTHLLASRAGGVVYIVPDGKRAAMSGSEQAHPIDRCRTGTDVWGS